MSLLENMQNEPVSRLALREPVVVKPSDSVRSAIEAMRRQDLGCAIVVDQGNKPVGILTEAAVTALVAHDPTAVDESWKSTSRRNGRGSSYRTHLRRAVGNGI